MGTRLLYFLFLLFVLMINCRVPSLHDSLWATRLSVLSIAILRLAKTPFEGEMPTLLGYWRRGLFFRLRNNHSRMWEGVTDLWFSIMSLSS